MRVRVMRESTGFRIVRAVVLEIRPADCDLGWVVFVSACEATIARTCHNRWLWLNGTGNRFGGKEVKLDDSAPVVVNLGQGLSTYFFLPWVPCDLSRVQCVAEVQIEPGPTGKPCGCCRTSSGDLKDPLVCISEFLGQLLTCCERTATLRGDGNQKKGV
jgi:hypothetical protein